MNNLCFYSLLASNQEVDFFTDILFDTDLAGEVMSDNPLITELESIPQEAILDEEAEALAEQFDIETAQDPEWLEYIETAHKENCGVSSAHLEIAHSLVRGIDI
jgi:hypothetical protein